MILMDFSQIAISNLHQQLKQSKKAPSNFDVRVDVSDVNDYQEGKSEAGELQPAMLRHMILNSIRRINRQFRTQYGRLVICTDGNNYWRKSAFQYYKANRKKDRDDSDIDWPTVFTVLDELRTEIHENFPYKVIDVPSAEADDIIGIIVKRLHKVDTLLIVSGDKDFMQLQAYPNVKQYGPVQDKFLETDDPKKFLFEHILHGDKGDGVPNFLSADDVLITPGKRQSPIYQTKVDLWYNQAPEEFCGDHLANYYRNKKLVDLSEIPVEVEAAIMEEFVKPVVGKREMIYPYLVRSRMKNLLELIRDF